MKNLRFLILLQTTQKPRRLAPFTNGRTVEVFAAIGEKFETTTAGIEELLKIKAKKSNLLNPKGDDISFDYEGFNLLHNIEAEVAVVIAGKIFLPVLIERLNQLNGWKLRVTSIKDEEIAIIDCEIEEKKLEFINKLSNVVTF